MGVNYDLSPIVRPGYDGLYVVTDVRDTSTKYYFDVCDDAPPPATFNSTCTSPASSGTGPRPNNANPATAWQIQPNSPSCYRLGQAATSGWNFTFFDPEYPARGIVLTYTGGESTFCPYIKTPTGYRPQQRSMSLEVVCAPLAGTFALSDQSVSVREENTCDYRVQIPSLAGCPTDCLTGTTVCNNNGACGFNKDSNRAQCYCYTGYGGAMCSDSGSGGSGGMSAEGVMLIIVCIALVGVLALVGFMFVKLRRLQVDPAAYQQLDNRFNELGQML